MKEQILRIAEKLRLELITEDEAQKLLLGLFGVNNKCEECGTELGKGMVFCSADCRIHYYR